MEAKELPIMALSTDDRLLVVTAEPFECPACHRAACFLVNRNLRTLCVDCDAHEVQKVEKP